MAYKLLGPWLMDSTHNGRKSGGGPPVPPHLEPALRGDREAWNELFAGAREGLRLRVEARLGRRLREHVEAEDILQETCLRAFTSREQFEWRGEASFLGWLATIANFVIREAARKHRRAADGIEGDVPGSAPAPSRCARRDERFERLLEAFQRLEPDHRKVLRLVRLEGLSVRAVAGRMNRSESAVRHLVLRALQKLREHFGEGTASLTLPQRQLSAEVRDDDG